MSGEHQWPVLVDLIGCLSRGALPGSAQQDRSSDDRHVPQYELLYRVFICFYTQKRKPPNQTWRPFRILSFTHRGTKGSFAPHKGPPSHSRSLPGCSVLTESFPVPSSQGLSEESGSASSISSSLAQQGNQCLRLNGVSAAGTQWQRLGTKH